MQFTNKRKSLIAAGVSVGLELRAFVPETPAFIREQDKREFIEFALNFITETGKHFLEPYITITKENRLRCK
jgi:hypothetical protein